MKFNGQTIAMATSGRLVHDGPAGPIATDTRQIEPGSWFLAIQGDRFDGHDFLEQAAAAGAAGAIVHREPEGEWDRGLVVVPDTTRALQALGRYVRRGLQVPIVGLTGSAGKTTTRAMIALALNQLGTVHQTQGNLNNHWGLPMTLVACPRDAAAVVLEMGTSSPGEIALLADLARPTVRLVVNVGPSHLLELGGIDGVAREKGALFATAEPGDVLVVNLDDTHIRNMPWPEWTTTVTYGVHPGAEIQLIDAKVRPSDLHTVASYLTPDGELTVDLPAPGHHLAHNVAAALAVAQALGLDLQQAARDIESYEPVGMRMRREELPGGVIALNDAYNANPSSMQASLGLLASLPGRRIAVLGAMLELGDEEDAWHARVVRLAGELGLDLVVLVGEQMGRAAPCCEGAGEVWVYQDAEEAAEALRPWLRPGDHVLFKGSRGARIERVIDALREGR